MGFNKRYIRKEMILDNSENVSYIAGLVNTDALIVDDWSDKFFKNFNFKWKTYNKIREEIMEATRFDSHPNGITGHRNYKHLFNLSNTLLNLKTNPGWIDIQLSYDILIELGYDFSIIENSMNGVPFEIAGKFDPLVEYHIKLIEDYYGQK